MGTFKNIIFDLGGVVLDIDYSTFSKAFTDLGAADFDKLYSQYKQHPLFDAFEMGLVTPDEFRPQLERLMGFKATAEAFDEAWNSIILHYPLANLELIRELRRQNTKIFVLSNTNLLHQQAFDALYRQQFGGSELAEIFDKAYYSHLVGMRKPNANIFELVLEENNLNPSETLFIDDTSLHTDTAARLGLHTIHLAKPKRITDLGLL